MAHAPARGQPRPWPISRPSMAQRESRKRDDVLYNVLMQDDGRRPRTIPKEKLWEYKECFDWFAVDTDRLIAVQDIGNLLRATGQVWSFAEIKKLMMEMSKRHVGRINFEQFLKIAARKADSDPRDALEELKLAFQVFDRNDNGLVRLDEVSHVVTTIGEALSPREFGELCQLAGIEPPANMRLRAADDADIVSLRQKSATLDFDMFVKLFTGMTPDGER